MSNIINVEDSQVIDILDGTERCYQFPMGYRNFNIQNLGDLTIYVSFDPDISSRSYGVIAILPGNTVNVENRYIEDNKLLYVSGTGRMQISGLNYSEMMHSNSGGSSLPGGGGEDNVIESVKVNGTTLPVGADKSVDVPVPTKVSQLTNDSGYISSAPIESVKVNDTILSIDSDKSVNITVPTKVSELSNDSGYIKSIPDEYATKTYVGEQIAAVDHLSRSIVETLPTDDVAEENVIYLIKVDDASGNDKYREYMKIDGHLQLVGDTSVDLTGYAKLTDIPTELPANGGNANTVNNHTVGTDVPADAKFTDTIYALPTATDSVLGGVKSGGDISVSESGDVTVNSVGGKAVNADVPADAKFTDTVYTLPAATAETLGGVKPDNTTVSVDTNGVLSAQKGIDSIEIGGTNILRQTKDMSSDFFSTNGWVLEPELYKDFSVYSRSAPLTGLGQSVNLDAGSIITFSFYAKSTTDNTDFMIGARSTEKPISIGRVRLSTEWKRYSVTYTIISSDTYKIYVEQSNLGDEATYPTVSVCGMKLEYGNKATSWSPAPEDLQYTLPIASQTELGGVKIDGTTITADENGVISASSGSSNVEPNAGAHNAVYRGKYLGDAVTDAQYAAIAAGTFDDLFIGDYWTIGGINYRIAAFDYYLMTYGLTTHHIVIVPDTIIGSSGQNDYICMNTDNTNTGGYAGSSLYKTGLETAKNIIKTAFSGHVLSHKISVVNAVTNNAPVGVTFVQSEVDLMTEQMVYGGAIYMSMNAGTIAAQNLRDEKTQLPLFTFRPDLIRTELSYWLRDTSCNGTFCVVLNTGSASCNQARSTCYIRPFFCIH